MMEFHLATRRIQVQPKTTAQLNHHEHTHMTLRKRTSMTRRASMMLVFCLLLTLLHLAHPPHPRAHSLFITAHAQPANDHNSHTHTPDTHNQHNIAHDQNTPLESTLPSPTATPVPAPSVAAIDPPNQDPAGDTHVAAPTPDTDTDTLDTITPTAPTNELTPLGDAIPQPTANAQLPTDTSTAAEPIDATSATRTSDEPANGNAPIVTPQLSENTSAAAQSSPSPVAVDAAAPIYPSPITVNASLNLSSPAAPSATVGESIVHASAPSSTDSIVLVASVSAPPPTPPATLPTPPVTPTAAPAAAATPIILTTPTATQKEEIPRLDAYKATVLEIVAEKKGKKQKKQQEQDVAAAAAAAAASNPTVTSASNPSPVDSGSSIGGAPVTSSTTPPPPVSATPEPPPTIVPVHHHQTPPPRETLHPAAIPRPPETSISDHDRDRFNYAAFDAGAKLLSVSDGMKKGNSILNSDDDRYMMVPCENPHKNFVVQLSEDIIIDTIELANLEHYASSVRDFQVLGSATHPTSQWLLLGTYTALESTQKQVFLLPSKEWVRFIKIRWISHYGSEYYCTLTYLRVYGMTMLETFREEMQKSEDDVKEITEELIHIKPLGVTTTTTTNTIVAPTHVATPTTIPVPHVVAQVKEEANVIAAPPNPTLTTTIEQKPTATPTVVTPVATQPIVNVQPTPPIAPIDVLHPTSRPRPSIFYQGLNNTSSLSDAPPSSHGDLHLTPASASASLAASDAAGGNGTTSTDSAATTESTNTRINNQTNTHTDANLHINSNLTNHIDSTNVLDSVPLASSALGNTTSVVDPHSASASANLAIANVTGAPNPTTITPSTPNAANEQTLQPATPNTATNANANQPTKAQTQTPPPHTTHTATPSTQTPQPAVPTSATPVTAVHSASIPSQPVPASAPILPSSLVASLDPSLLAEAHAIVERISIAADAAASTSAMKEIASSKSSLSGLGSTVGGGGQQQSIFKALTNRIKELEIHQALANNYVSDLAERYAKDMSSMKVKMDSMLLEMAAHVARNEKQWQDGWAFMNATAEYVQADNHRILQQIKSQLDEAQYFITLVEGTIRVQLLLTALITIGYFLGRSLWTLVNHLLRWCCTVSTNGKKKNVGRQIRSKSTPNLTLLAGDLAIEPALTPARSARRISNGTMGSPNNTNGAYTPFPTATMGARDRQQHMLHQRALSMSVGPRVSSHGAYGPSSSPAASPFGSNRRIGAGVTNHNGNFNIAEHLRNEAPYAERSEEYFIDQYSMPHGYAQQPTLDQFNHQYGTHSSELHTSRAELDSDETFHPRQSTPVRRRTSRQSISTSTQTRMVKEEGEDEPILPPQESHTAATVPVNSDSVSASASPVLRPRGSGLLSRWLSSPALSPYSAPPVFTPRHRTLASDGSGASTLLGSPVPSPPCAPSTPTPTIVPVDSRRVRAQTLPSPLLTSLLGGLRSVAGSTISLLGRSATKNATTTIDPKEEEDTQHATMIETQSAGIDSTGIDKLRRGSGSGSDSTQPTIRIPSAIDSNHTGSPLRQPFSAPMRQLRQSSSPQMSRASPIVTNAHASSLIDHHAYELNHELEEPLPPLSPIAASPMPTPSPRNAHQNTFKFGESQRQQDDHDDTDIHVKQEHRNY